MSVQRGGDMGCLYRGMVTWGVCTEGWSHGVVFSQDLTVL